VLAADTHIRVQSPLALDPMSEPDPDLVVVRGRPRAYRSAHPETALLVIEVAERTLAFDRGRKASLYLRAGIPEHWLADLLP
jgi:Uma2 family endonuclease